MNKDLNNWNYWGTHQLALNILWRQEHLSSKHTFSLLLKSLRMKHVRFFIPQAVSFLSKFNSIKTWIRFKKFCSSCQSFSSRRHPTQLTWLTRLKDYFMKACLATAAGSSGIVGGCNIWSNYIIKPGELPDFSANKVFSKQCLHSTQNIQLQQTHIGASLKCFSCYSLI